MSIFTVIWPLSQMGGEFLPKINEGDLLYMPSTLPGVSPAEAATLLQTTDKLIKTVPEVASVFGKTGKAETATDPAPLEMVETTIQLKPEDQWRPGMTIDKIIEELDKTVRLPGLANLWCRRSVTASTCFLPGLKAQLVSRCQAPFCRISTPRRRALKRSPKPYPAWCLLWQSGWKAGVTLMWILIVKSIPLRYDGGGCAAVVSSAIGGETVGETVEGVARYPIIRYPQDYRNSPQALKEMPILTPMKQQITLGMATYVSFPARRC